MTARMIISKESVRAIYPVSPTQPTHQNRDRREMDKDYRRIKIDYKPSRTQQIKVKWGDKIF